MYLLVKAFPFELSLRKNSAKMENVENKLEDIDH